MSSILPKQLEELIEAFSILPGVGPRTAERYALSIMRGNQERAKRLSSGLANLHSQIKLCPITFMIIGVDETESSLYTSPRRDKKIIAVVEDPLDVVAIEKTNQFQGTYHILGGVLSPIDGINPEQLHIPELISRIQKDKVTELILATNASVEGESTALYIQKAIQDAKLELSISRLARGIPVGLDLEYADIITLKHALEGRTALYSNYPKNS
jgi:recombination protein RecR